MDIEAIRRDAEHPVQATRADLAGVAADLAAAFADDVMFDWFMRDDDRRAAAQGRFFKTVVERMAFGAARIDRPAGGGAAAIWMPYEAVIKPTSWRDELAILPTLLNATGFARFGRLLAVREDMDKHHPMDRPHAYLWFLGVAPAAQGRGIGSRLLKSATDRLDAAGEAAYLETQTERNIALYLRHGFTVISEHRPRPEAPMLWSMWREAQTAE